MSSSPAEAELPDVISQRPDVISQRPGDAASSALDAAEATAEATAGATAGATESAQLAASSPAEPSRARAGSTLQRASSVEPADARPLPEGDPPHG